MLLLWRYTALLTRGGRPEDQRLDVEWNADDVEEAEDDAEGRDRPGGGRTAGEEEALAIVGEGGLLLEAGLLLLLVEVVVVAVAVVGPTCDFVFCFVGVLAALEFTK